MTDHETTRASIARLERSLAIAGETQLAAAEEIRRFTGVYEDAVKLEAVIRDRLAVLRARLAAPGEAPSLAPVDQALVGRFGKITGGGVYVGQIGEVTYVGSAGDAVDVKIVRGPLSGDAYTVVELKHFELLAAADERTPAQVENDREAAADQDRPFHERVERLRALGCHMPLTVALEEAHQAALSYQESRDLITALKAKAADQVMRAAGMGR